MSQGFPPFRARAPWWGPDLQTLRNTLVRGAGAGEANGHRTVLLAEVPGRLTLPMSDGSGDVLVARVERPAHATRPTVVLVHGLAGSEDSSYMQVSAAHHLARGHRVVRLNLRGSGPSRPLCREQYHAGRAGDLRDALLALPPDLREDGLYLVGYSLGGNVLIKLLARQADDLPILGAASVSAPIDLARSSERFREPRNRIYQWSMLRYVKREALAAGPHITPAEARAVRAARSIYDFDEHFVAPRNGYTGADDYYEQNSGRHFLGEVRVPMLVIHALDDPWIPGECYLEVPWQQHPLLTPLLPRQGGHVGFHGPDPSTPWHDLAIGLFFDRLEGLRSLSDAGAAAEPAAP